MYQVINTKPTTGNDEADSGREKENAATEKCTKCILKIPRHTRYR